MPNGERPSRRGVLMTIHRLSQGGADRVAILLANAFVTAGISTEIVILRDGGEGEAALLTLLHADVRISRAGPPLGSRHLELLRGLRFIQRRIDASNASVLLASSSNMGLVTGVAARVMPKRTCLRIMKLTNPVVRPQDEWWLRRFYRHRLYAFIFGNFDRVLILTDAERDRLIVDFPRQHRKFETVANPYITPAMTAVPDRARNSAAPVVLTLARMMPQKRLDRLLHAFTLITNRAARLVILGDGPERAALTRLAHTLGIPDRVDMPGFVENVAPWYGRAHLFALSSDYEGLPAAVLEALACEIPVVTTDCFDGAHALLDGARGCAVVPRNDVAAFAGAIDRGLSGGGEPGCLRDLTLAYTLEAGAAAHRRALGFSEEHSAIDPIAGIPRLPS